MKMKRKGQASRLAIVLLGALLAANVQAGDAVKGKQKASQVCAACHGADGNKPSAPDQPVLAGQYEDYLVRALTDYKLGKRTNPIMKGFAGQLSKQDIEDLAAWFSSQEQTSLHNQR
jgi:cytochrome c553